jgi:hypothetical protein
MREYNFGKGPQEGKASYVWSPACALFEIGLAGGEVASTLPPPVFGVFSPRCAG